MEYALGMIEIKGLIGAIEAADAMTKTAAVHLIGYELATGGYTCVKISGEVAAVQSAVEEAANRSSRVGELISVHVIPKPHCEVDSLTQSVSNKVSPELNEKEISISRLKKLSVTQLRKLARKTSGIDIKGRDISKANKEKLIKEIIKTR